MLPSPGRTTQVPGSYDNFPGDFITVYDLHHDWSQCVKSVLISYETDTQRATAVAVAAVHFIQREAW